MKKVFVTGASGMLGTTLYSVFTDANYEVISTDLNPLDPWTIKLDIRNKTKVIKAIEKANPQYVLNLAALTDVEYCETHSQETYDTNSQGAENVAIACAKLDIPLVHISTAGVFDGQNTIPYTESDIPNPLNIYGKAKLEGEKVVSKTLEKFYIFRAGWMMGSGERDKKFVKKVLNLIDKGNKTIYGLTDAYGCPTYTLDFAQGILKMLELKEDYGLYHMVSEGHCSRYDVAQKLLEILNLKNIKLEPVAADFFKESFFAPRPAFEVIQNQRLHSKNLHFMRNWEDALVDYLKIPFFDKYR